MQYLLTTIALWYNFCIVIWKIICIFVPKI
nr:MAG TPA: hypothetical protein [Caudoviricetes sp.]DAS87851.1 MAG TPA: hypothetical protein [Caudoviricetes sp.]DAT18814.1 MAG TPA: hypothetical protein [Bacteriophage sp.]